MIVLILLILAAVLVLLEAFGVTPPRVSLGWLGLFCFILVALLGAVGAR